MTIVLTNQIVTDAEITRVHANANFGSMTKRHVVDEGVLNYFFRYSGGSTQISILVEHGLIHQPKYGRSDSTLTPKGRKYLQALGYDVLKAFGELRDREPKP